MPLILKQKRIYREDLRANPDILYVFGDNLIRAGMGGQAGEMRHEPNAFGVATKKSPGMVDYEFFTDNVEDMAKVVKDLTELSIVAKRYRAVVLPLDGIGTGLSQLPTRAPKLHEFITEWFRLWEREDDNLQLSESVK